jgi:hypothetical protein
VTLGVSVVDPKTAPGGMAFIARLDRALDGLASGLELLGRLGRERIDDPPATAVADALEQVALLQGLQRSLPAVPITFPTTPVTGTVRMPRALLVQVLLAVVAYLKGRSAGAGASPLTVTLEPAGAQIAFVIESPPPPASGEASPSKVDLDLENDTGLWTARWLVGQSGGTFALTHEPNGALRAVLALPSS